MEWLELSFELPNNCDAGPYQELLSRYVSGVVLHDPRAIARHVVSGSWDAHEFEPEILAQDRLKLTVYLTDEERDLVPVIVTEMENLAAKWQEDLRVLPVQTMADEDWANSWKQHYHVMHFGKRIQVVPEWMEPEEPVDLVIRIDPGLAFGTGDHDTTGLCLGLLEELVQPGMTVFDMGCGSGILAIAAKQLGAGLVRAYDFDPLAVKATVSNAVLNGMELPALQSDLCQAVVGKADLIIANIVTDVLLRLLPQLSEHLAPGGRILLSGIINERAEELLAAYSAMGYELVERRATDEWTALVLQRS